jgi:hypothetical protein
MEKARVDPVDCARAIVFRYIARDIFESGNARPEAAPSDRACAPGTWSPRAAAVAFLCILTYMAGIAWFVACHGAY